VNKLPNFQQRINARLLNWINCFADTPWRFIGKALEVSKSIAGIRKGSTNFLATLPIA
jgi:hypothetical protein